MYKLIISFLAMTLFCSFSAQANKIVKLPYKKNKFHMLHCYKFCANATDNNCDGVFWKKYPKKPGASWEVKKLYHYNKRKGGICARNRWGTKKISFQKVKNECGCQEIKTVKRQVKKRDMRKRMTESTRVELEQRRIAVMDWALCHDYSNYGRNSTRDSIGPCNTMRTKIKVPLHHPEYDQQIGGDRIIVAGMLCLSGEKEFCDMVQATQDLDPESPTYGAFFRSPTTMKDPTYTGNHGTHFSRDMLTGLMAYLAKTKDRKAAKLWLEFLRKNKKIPRLDVPVLKWFKNYNICPLFGGESKADERCSLALDSWSYIRRVYKHLGLVNKDDMHPKMLRIMNNRRIWGGIGIWANATFAPTEGKGVYQSNLHFNHIMARRQTGQNLLSMRMGGAAQARNSRFMNPYFTFLKWGASEVGARRLLEACPERQPDFGRRLDIPSNPEIRGTFMWNRYVYRGTSEPYGGVTTAGGHECLLALNFYLGNHLE